MTLASRSRTTHGGRSNIGPDDAQFDALKTSTSTRAEEFILDVASSEALAAWDVLACGRTADERDVLMHGYWAVSAARMALGWASGGASFQAPLVERARAAIAGLQLAGLLDLGPVQPSPFRPDEAQYARTVRGATLMLFLVLKARENGKR